MEQTKRKNPYARELLLAPDYGTPKVREEDTLLPSERCQIPVDVDWIEDDIVELDEMVYLGAYRI